MTPRVLILRAPGTNCDQEAAFAFDTAGGKAEVVHLNRLLENPGLAKQYQILCLPGGFSYGDDISAGRIFGNQMRHHLRDCLAEFKAAGKLILGICNGFQILIKSGVLLPDRADEPIATLTLNASGKFEDRWVYLRVAAGKCVFLRGIERMYLPVAHAEGQFVARDAETLQRLDTVGQLVLRYTVGPAFGDQRLEVRGQVAAAAASAQYSVLSTAYSETAAVPSTNPQSAIRNPYSPDPRPPTPDSPVPYPANPNGAQFNIAGLCDETGRVFGLMPHPERHIDPTHHPRWTREKHERGDGLAVFENAVRFFG